MDIIKLKIHGLSAFFKKPDINSIYLTFSSIHKIILMGLFGATVGYGGYEQQKRTNSEYPEFYEKFKNIKVSIVPHKKFFNKKIQTYNNSTGFVTGQAGGNLIIKEQWLENPAWDIYVIIDSEETKSLKKYIEAYKTEYSRFLGRRNHECIISEYKFYENVPELSLNDEVFKIDSLFIDGNYVIQKPDAFDLIESNTTYSYPYKEMLPIGLDSEFNHYIFEYFVLTENPVKKVPSSEDSILCEIEGKILSFY